MVILSVSLYHCYLRLFSMTIRFFKVSIIFNFCLQWVESCSVDLLNSYWVESWNINWSHSLIQEFSMYIWSLNIEKFRRRHIRGLSKCIMFSSMFQCSNCFDKLPVLIHNVRSEKYFLFPGILIICFFRVNPIRSCNEYEIQQEQPKKISKLYIMLIFAVINRI